MDDYQRAIADHAAHLGINDPNYLWLAEESLNAALPDNWATETDATTGALYYYNSDTGESSWDHPLDAAYRERYAALKASASANEEADAVTAVVTASSVWQSEPPIVALSPSPRQPPRDKSSMQTLAHGGRGVSPPSSPPASRTAGLSVVDRLLAESPLPSPVGARSSTAVAASPAYIASDAGSSPDRAVSRSKTGMLDFSEQGASSTLRSGSAASATSVQLPLSRSSAPAVAAESEEAVDGEDDEDSGAHTAFGEAATARLDATHARAAAADMRAELESHRVELETAKIELETARAALEDARAEAAQLQEALAASNEYAESLTFRVADLHSQLNRTTKQASKDSEGERLRSQARLLAEAAAVKAQDRTTAAEARDAFNFQLREMEAYRVTAENLAAELQAQLAAAQAAVAAAQEEAAAARAEAQAAHEQVEHLEHQFADLQETPSHASAEDAALRTQVEEMRAELESAKEEAASSSEYAESLSFRIAELHQHLHNKQAGGGAADTLRVHGRVAAEAAAVLARDRAAAAEHRRATEEMLTDLDEQVTAARSDATAARLEAVEARTAAGNARAELETLRAESAAREQEADRLAEDLAAAQEQLQQAVQLNEELQRQLEEAQRAVETSSEYAEGLTFRIAELHADLHKARSAAAATADESVQALDAQLVSTQQRLAQVEGELAQARSERAALSSADVPRTVLRDGQITALEQGVDELRQALEAAEERLQQQIASQMEAQIQQQRQHVSQVEEMEASLDAANAALSTATEERSRLQVRVAELGDELARLQSELSSVHSLKDAAEADAEEARVRAATAEEEAQARAAAAEAEALQLRQERDEAHIQLQEMQQSATVAAEAAASVHATVLEAERVAAQDLQQQVAELQSEITSLQSQLGSAHAAATEADAKTATAEALYQQSQADVAASIASLASMREELINAQNTLAEAQQEQERLVQRCEELQQEAVATANAHATQVTTLMSRLDNETEAEEARVQAVVAAERERIAALEASVAEATATADRAIAAEAEQRMLVLDLRAQLQLRADRSHDDDTEADSSRVGAVALSFTPPSSSSIPTEAEGDSAYALAAAKRAAADATAALLHAEARYKDAEATWIQRSEALSYQLRQAQEQAADSLQRLSNTEAALHHTTAELQAALQELVELRSRIAELEAAVADRDAQVQLLSQSVDAAKREAEDARAAAAAASVVLQQVASPAKHILTVTSPLRDNDSEGASAGVSAASAGVAAPAPAAVAAAPPSPPPAHQQAYSPAAASVHSPLLYDQSYRMVRSPGVAQSAAASFSPFYSPTTPGYGAALPTTQRLASPLPPPAASMDSAPLLTTQTVAVDTAPSTALLLSMNSQLAALTAQMQLVASGLATAQASQVVQLQQAAMPLRAAAIAASASAAAMSSPSTTDDFIAAMASRAAARHAAVSELVRSPAPLASTASAAIRKKLFRDSEAASGVGYTPAVPSLSGTTAHILRDMGLNDASVSRRRLVAEAETAGEGEGDEGSAGDELVTPPKPLMSGYAAYAGSAGVVTSPLPAQKVPLRAGSRTTAAVPVPAFPLPGVTAAASAGHSLDASYVQAGYWKSRYGGKGTSTPLNTGWAVRRSLAHQA